MSKIARPSKTASSLLTNVVHRWDTLRAPTPEALEASRIVFQQPAHCAWNAAVVGSIPAPTIPEIAFLGRSNVGKSSLMNVLMHRTRSKLVRTSSRAGSTQTMKGFPLAASALCLVDTPGYGYKSRDAWGRSLVAAYLRHRTSLKRACLLVDAEHGFKAHDEALMAQLVRTGVPFQLILTKVDKLKRGQAQVESLMREAEARLRECGGAAAWPEVICVSCDARRLGVAQLRYSLAQVAGVLGKHAVA